MFGDLNPRNGARQPLGHMLVYRATNVAAGSAAIIPFDAVDVDTDGLWSPSLSAAVIKRGGLYFLGAYLRNASTPTATDVRIIVNGVSGSVVAISASSGSLYNQAVCMALLSPGDQVSVSLSNAITISAAAKLSRFEIFGPLA